MTIKAALLGSGGGMLLLAGLVVYNAGAVRVSVEEKRPGGDHIRLIVPAVAVPIGLKLAPRDKLREAAAEIRPWLPAIERASEVLARAQDGPLVLVDSDDEHVSILKEGSSLGIHVDSKDETVHLSFPLKTLASAAAELASKGDVK